MVLITYVIDDDEISSFITSNALEVSHFSERLKRFFNANEALQDIVSSIVSDNLPQFIFLDLNMPFMDGWEFLDALSAYESMLTGKVHLYILSSSICRADRERAQNYMLVSGFTHKPLSEEVIEHLKATYKN